MSGIRNFNGLTAGAAMALALAGCGTASDLASGEAKWFPSTGSLFRQPNLQVNAPPSTVNVSRPITPADLVDPAGYCNGPPEPAVAAAAPPAAPAASSQPAPVTPRSTNDGPLVPGTNTSAPQPNNSPVASNGPAFDGPAPPGTATPAIVGGISLNMTECQVVHRAGHPESVQIGRDGHGERNVVLTYVHGERPGIYHFVAGRLRAIERAPEPLEPPKRKRRGKRRV